MPQYRRSDQGMYQPFYEHDACGVGFVANIDGKQTHKIIRQGLQVLENLEHRGACGCDPDTGDGAGMIVQTPDRFFRREAERLGFELPKFGGYATGMLFLPHSDSDRKTCEAIIERSALEEGQSILGWRDVPHDADAIGWLAREGMPVIRQVFIKAAPSQDVDTFERKLFLLRKVIEHAIAKENLKEADKFYFSSLSARTVCYKGLMLAPQTARFYSDLSEDDFESAIALVHQRYSTNTFPSWPLAQPFRFLAHNGEINTLRGNLNMLRSREVHIASDLFGQDIKKLAPVHTIGASDSASFDESYELLMRGGRTPAHAMMMMVPEPWQGHDTMSDSKRAFYEYHACMQEPWDGPASMAFTDGVQIGAVLDRNGLRPSRYWVTDDNFVVMASEAGVLDVPQEKIIKKGRLQPGRMFLIDTAEQRIVNDEELKDSICSRQPYRTWLDTHRVSLPDEVPSANGQQHDEVPLLERQQVFGYTLEDQEILLYPMALDGVQPLGSMGNDTPLAVLSKRPQLLFNYFKQLFAQVTNPPIDPIREEIVMSLETDIGCERNLLAETPEHCEQLHLKSPIITDEQCEFIKRIDEPGIKSATISTLFPAKDGAAGVEAALDRICNEASKAIADGATILILSDRGVSKDLCPLSSLLATGAVHHHLVREQIRTECGIVVESGEPREVMHFCLLSGYGAGAVNAYMAFETLDEAVRNEVIVEEYPGSAHKNFIKAIEKGMLKTMAKIGISTQHSYRSAQIFEALGLGQTLVDRCFAGTASRIGGIEVDDVGRESLIRHAVAYPKEHARPRELDPGGYYHWRKRGEFHQYNPETVSRIQHAVRSDSEQKYREYAEMVNSRDRNTSQLRALFKFKKNPIPLDEVEPWTELVKRFCTGAMSYGSISREAHENLAIAMNRIGGRSNTGEGGEDPHRFTADANGDLRRSKIKQVASGRFGVTNEYLVNSDEIQIKMAQGAKPGEGGELPGRKVFQEIAKVRYSTPGVGLISPPPHHDIYSIEDLAQLIHDLKNANIHGDVSVKLVSEVGVGTVAAGVAKGKSDLVTVSGDNGGTGASPLSSIKHAGLPWELGLSETHQVLVENDLRSRIRVQTDGQMKTGRDVAIGFLLGADEIAFATLPLIASGCIMMRKCHLNTCPVGIATQDPELRAKFDGQPDHVVNLFHFIAEECRAIMAELGFRTVNEMIGRADRLEYDPLPDHWKASKLDLSRVLHVPNNRREDATLYCSETQDHGIDKALDHQLIASAAPALQPKDQLEDVEKIRFDVTIRNINRTVGTMLSSELTRQHKLGMYTGSLQEDTVWIDCHGIGGQSFGAFSVKGVTLNVDGEANDYCGKGLSGGKIIVRPPSTTSITPEEHIVVGNVALYGATAGEAYFRGIAGERFCVRNSGAWAVAEGVGDHACEYMTGGRAAILGPTGRNFAAGMSGGIAFVYDPSGIFKTLCNPGLVDLKSMNEKSQNDLRYMLERHVTYTESTVAQRVLDNWDVEVNNFVRVMPRDYARVLEEMNESAGEPEMAEV